VNLIVNGRRPNRERPEGWLSRNYLMRQTGREAAELSRFYTDMFAVHLDDYHTGQDDEHLVARGVKMRALVRPPTRRLVEPDLKHLGAKRRIAWREPPS
jgi:hypothetical protein